MSESDKGQNLYTSEVPVLYPSPEKEARMFIRRADWSRVKRALENIRPEAKFMRTAYSICGGISITAGFSIYSAYKIPEKSPWLVPTYAITTIAAFALAIILFFVDRHVTKSSTGDIKLILKDMQEIEDTFKKETGEKENGKPKTMGKLTV